MKSNLRQHITSMVKDYIPLGGPTHHRVDDRRRDHSVPQSSPQGTNKKNEHTLKPLNPLVQCTPPPHKTFVQGGRDRSSTVFSAGPKKIIAKSQKSPTNGIVPMRKVQFNNNIHLDNDRSCQSARKKNASLQRKNSYVQEKEFALAFCKQLNENLKVGGSVLQTGNSQQKMPSVHPPLISSSKSESHKALAPPNSQRRQSFQSSASQQSQPSVKKMHKPSDWDQCSSLLSQGEHAHHQANTPGVRSLSLKRRRTSSAERHGDGKRLCQEDVGFVPTPICVSSSNVSSPPKFVKCAFLKTTNSSVLTLNEKKSPTNNNHAGDRIKSTNNVSKQLFQEPRPESHKLSTILSIVVDGTGHQKEEVKRSTENKWLIDNSSTTDPCHSLSSKLNKKQSSPVFSYTSSVPSHMDKSKTCNPLQQEVTSPPFFNIMGSHNSKTITKERKDVADKQDLVWKDPIDLELGEEMEVESCVLSLSSSHSSAEDHLLSLKEILEGSTRVPDTPEKTTFSEPSTPGFKLAPEDLKSKAPNYKNTLEQMLKEKEQNQKAKELEMQLLQACKEDLLKLDEDENAEAGLSHEQKEFLQRFSVSSCVIRDVHPGEEVFALNNSGRLFSHQSLDLRKIGVTPKNREQERLLQARSEQLVLQLCTGLFRRAYSSSPCQPQVTRWLFQMMSVHPNPVICDQILQDMKSIALSAATQIVEKNNKKFMVWVPSIQDVALVFINMGVSFVSLFPLEDLQPPFTEGDLLESLEIKPDGTRPEKESDPFPQHNFVNIIKYLTICAALCPMVYSDEELLLLLTLVCRVSLETHLQLLPTGDLCCLLQHILSNMTHWELQLPKVCQAITNLSEDHHNLRRLVQLLPHSGRGKQLKRHVSVSVISKLLNHRCTYTPSCTEFQLSDLRRYLPRMRPSMLLKGLMAAKITEPQESDDVATTPDQQAYYLCYSLLALTNEASNFEFLPSTQRNELLLLSAELEKHVKCDIRESEKMLYRSKVKDFVARIYTKWQVLLQRSRPREGKLYDYWKPLPEDEVSLKDESQFTEQEDAEESLTEESDIVQSEEEECMEEKDEVPVESEEQLEDSVEQIPKKIEEFQEAPSDIKEEQSIRNQDDEEAEEKKDDSLIDELLRSCSHGSVETDEDEDEEELLKDDETLEKNGDLAGGENDESDKVDDADLLHKTNKEVLLNEIWTCSPRHNY
ncbi:SMC5-SMC6 complex localization factor protein 2 isoform 2-T4 [Clarias gariepinus]|uniref:SMC5-SMC6 complex localization factor protein 2 isoform X2 n=1 Tax=Clarias gariepinus TaxID=13013 RepID=UPI00234C47CC|nr:SMC5-SMC6 complex localization factor protein 2 isoform X2 [Clarias gariepinus]